VVGCLNAVVGHNSCGWVNLVPLLTMKTRVALEKKYGLERQCGHPYCADYWCFSCSAYQQAFFVKHTLKEDFTCCTYKDCCSKHCCSCCGERPAPGEAKRGGPTPPKGYEAVTEQPGFV